MQPSGWAELPTELLRVIFEAGDPQVSELVAVGRVCRRWRDAASQLPPSKHQRLHVLPTSEQELDVSKQRKAVAHAAAGGPRPVVLTVEEAAEALRKPAFAAVQRLVLNLSAAPKRSRADGPRPSWELGPLGPVLPSPLSALEIVPHSFELCSDPLEKAVTTLRLGEHAPSLRELRVRGWTMHIDHVHTGLVAPSLRYLGAKLVDSSATELRAAAPELKRFYGLSLWSEAGSLPQLAAAGLRCRRAELSFCDLAAPGMAEALGDVLRPAEFDEADGPADLVLYCCTLPEAWPGGLPRGLQSVELQRCEVGPGALRWLFEGAHARTLRRVCFGRTESEFGDVVVHPCSFRAISPRAFLDAVGYLPEGVRVLLEWPEAWLPSPNADKDLFVPAMTALVGSARLLRAVDAVLPQQLPPSLRAERPLNPRARAAYLQYRAAWARAQGLTAPLDIHSLEKELAQLQAGSNGAAGPKGKAGARKK
eukprot:tig00021135_g18956.t1